MSSAIDTERARDRIGSAKSLVWPGTEAGGDLLTIEAAVMSGKGKSTYTGQLGDVMQESIQAAISVVRTRAQTLGISPDFYQKHDIHIHVPEGATPKDGPSAGGGNVHCARLRSVRGAGEVECRNDREITLRGAVLPIGGLKEKLLAALRGGMETVMIPEENQRELIEIPANIKQNLDIRAVKWIDQVLEVALQRMPECVPDEGAVVDAEQAGEGGEPREPLTTH